MSEERTTQQTTEGNLLSITSLFCTFFLENVKQRKNSFFSESTEGRAAGNSPKSILF